MTRDCATAPVQSKLCCTCFFFEGFVVDEIHELISGSTFKPMLQVLIEPTKCDQGPPCKQDAAAIAGRLTLAAALGLGVLVTKLLNAMTETVWLSQMLCVRGMGTVVKRKKEGWRRKERGGGKEGRREGGKEGAWLLLR